jgi:hypothetical protein
MMSLSMHVGGEAMAEARSRPPVRLQDRFIHLIEHFNVTWGAMAKPDDTVEDALRPEYLGHRWERMRIGDEVVIRHHDWLLKSIVVKIDEATRCVWHTPQPGYPMALKVTLIEADLSRARVDEVGGVGWRVLLDNDILVDGLRSRADAEAWLAKKVAGYRDARW